MKKRNIRHVLRRGTAGSRRNSGFTMLEMLLTVAILVILLGLSMVGVARWRDPLRITELDNAARAIYMAAENRSVLLQGGGTAASRLSSTALTGPTVTFPDGETKNTVNTAILSQATDPDILDDLLPDGSIDPALRSGYFYVLYDKNTCHAFEVFYAEKSFSQAELDNLRVSRSQRIAYYRADTANRCLVGYYGGGLAGKADSGAVSLPEPGVEVTIENGEELTLTVKYTIPPGPAGVTMKRKPSVTLKYGEAKARLLDTDETTGVIINRYPKRGERNETYNLQGTIVTYTWVLDSLAKDSEGNPQRFQDFTFDSVIPSYGDGFTVTADLRLSADGCLDGKHSAQASENSLFAAGSDGDTAYIINLRHLQNLDTAFSGAAGKATAVQVAQIDAGTYKGEPYEFRPIVNWALYHYTARSPEGTDVPYAITDLRVTPASAAGKDSAGLFGIAQVNFEFKNIRLADSKIAGGSLSAGGLMGYSWNPAIFENCQVVNTKITSNLHAGGLMGYPAGRKPNNPEGGTFRNCQVVKTTVDSSGVAGGMVGFGGSGSISFENCIVEDVTVESKGSYAGGLMGSESNGGSVEFLNCTVGQKGITNITVDGTQAGGLLGNADGETRITNCTVGTSGDKEVTVTGDYYAGGLVGNSGHEKNEFTGCSVFNASVTGTGGGSAAGGLVGGATEAFLENCTAKEIIVDGQMNAGGLMGQAIDVSLTDCEAGSIHVKGVGFAGGLVANATGGHFSGCKAVDASVHATTEAGGLVGRTTGTNLSGCQVYWDPPSGLTKDSDQVTATTAGGLVGTIRKGGLISNSFAATLVRGDTYAGGLVGNLADPTTVDEWNPVPDGQNNVRVETSYADCCIRAGQKTAVEGVDYFYAGGLIGIMANNVTLELKNVYAAGFIDMDKGGTNTATGLCGGWVPNGSITITNAYAAMRCTGYTSYPRLTESTPTTSSDCYYLSTDGTTWPAGYQTYPQMRSLTMPGDAWTRPASSTRRYGLHDFASAEASYPFPALQGLPHYGDWPKE